MAQSLLIRPPVPSLRTRRWPTTSKGLQLRYKFDEGAGLRAFDSSGLQRNGTLAGATKPARQVGAKGRCLYFGGAGYVVTPSFGLSGTVVVFACQVRCKVWASDYQVLISSGASLDGNIYLLRDKNTYKLLWSIGVNLYYINDYFASPYEDVWLHLCEVVDYAGKKLYSYRNATLFNTTTLTGTPLFPSTNNVKNIGTHSNGTAYPLTGGYLRDVQLWTLATMPPLAVMNASIARIAAGGMPCW